MLSAIRASIGCTIFGFLTVAAHAATVPTTLNFSGKTTKPDGTYTVYFRIYDATQTNITWHETETGVVVKGGVFSVVLGKTTPITPTVLAPPAYVVFVFSGDTVWSPVQTFGSVPYAVLAGGVVNGGVTSAALATGAVTSGKIAAGAVTTATIATGAVTTANVADHSITAAKLAPGIISGGASGTAGGDLSGTYPNPTVAAGAVDHTKLASDGSSLAQVSGGQLAAAKQLQINGTAGESTAIFNIDGTSTWDFGVRNSGNFFYFGDGSRYVLTMSKGTGYVGIGNNPNPAAALDVTGDVNVTGGIGMGGGMNVGGVPRFQANMNIDNGKFLGQTNGDTFQYDSKTMGHYSLGWFSDSWDQYGPSAWISGYGGVKLFTGGTPRMAIDGNGNVGIGTTTPQSTLDVNGTVTAHALQLTGGSDVAEPYQIASTDDVAPIPGMVVVIDTEHVGQMKVADRPYDKTVGGIISGANRIDPGLVLRQSGSLADGTLPIASSGRVWCYCDADMGAIQAGDMLTTSAVPGYAMRVSDSDGDKSRGAVIGKAMSTLDKGKGLVLVLVTLQ